MSLARDPHIHMILGNLRPHVRFNSTKSKSSEFLVLTARRSGILPRKRPAAQKSIEKRSSAFLADLESSQNELISEDRSKKEKQPVFANIASLRPTSGKLSEQHYDNLFQRLKKGFTKGQLANYLKSENINVASYVTKGKMIQQLMAKSWKLEKLSNSDEFTVENVIELRERDFVLFVGKDGHRVREWAKTGAVIRLNPEKYQLSIKATQQTFDWISASVHRLQDAIKYEEVSISEYRKLKELSADQLKVIQWLTSTYFTVTDSNALIIYSLDKRSIMHAKRLLATALPQPQAWASSTYFYDVNQENLLEYRFAENSDMMALKWHQRLRTWFRWEQVKRRNPIDMQKPIYRPLEAAEFTDTTESNSESIEDKIVTNIKKLANDKTQINMTATLGAIVHHKDGDYLLPNAGLEKTFSTNVPLVRRLASQLGGLTLDTPLQLGNDTATSDELPEAEPTEHVPEEKSKDPWDFLLEERAPQLVTRPSEISAPKSTQILRVKLVPSPFQDEGSRLYNEKSPVEIWCPLEPVDRNPNRRKLRISVDDVQAVKVPYEHHEYVSLSHETSDIRFTVSDLQFLDVSDDVKEFVESCALDKNGPIYIRPEVEIEGIKYQVTDWQFILQGEFNFEGNLLQLMTCDGGEVGGHTIEANLVMYKDERPDEGEIEKFVRDAFKLVEQTSKVRVNKTVI